MNNIRRVLYDAFGRLADVLGMLVRALLKRDLSGYMSGTSNCVFSTANLIIRYSMGYILNEATQQSGMILIP